MNQRISQLENEVDKLNVDIQELTDFCRKIMNIIKTDQDRMELLEETMCQLCTGEMPESPTIIGPSEADPTIIGPTVVGAIENTIEEVDISDINLNETPSSASGLENLAAYNATSYFSEKKMSIEDAVLTENWTEANRLAKLSGATSSADNLEGRVLQGDYKMAKILAEQRRDE